MGVKSIYQRVEVNTLPARECGWVRYDKPDDYNKYSVDYPIVPADIAVLLEPAIAQARAEFEKKCEAEGWTIDEYVDDAEEVIEDALRNPVYGDKDRKDYPVEDFGPYLSLSGPLKEGVAQKSGKPYRIRPKAWSVKGELLNADKVSLYPGSVLKPIISVAFYAPEPPKARKGQEPNPVIAYLSIRLEGIILVKPKKGTGSKPKVDFNALANEFDLSDDDLDMSDFLGSDEPGSDDLPDEDSDPFA